MTLSSGTRFGAYEIVSVLGIGGMGEVYRARDARLGRDVAIKILPAAVAVDPDRLARFDREARLLASLNHPHVAAIYGVEHADGRQALVLELVEGETLADRLGRGPIAAADAIVIARQIVEALDAAHERGIIHRDLKPANINITPDGAVKVLDFGLAKAAEAEAGFDPAVSSVDTFERTRAGVVLGTAAYMSPEQARGQAVDKRTDVWAFGCVLFEMLTGRRPFGGSDLSDTIASVLRNEPDWSALPADPALGALLRRCLEKDRRRRLRDIGDVSLFLDGAVRQPALQSSPVRGRIAWAIGAAAAGVALGAGLVALRSQAVPPAAATSRFELTSPPGQTFDATAFGANVAISPDGTRIVYTSMRGGVRELVVRRLDQLASAPIPGTEGAFGPFFSADGVHVGFSTIGELKRVPVDGGPVSVICKVSPLFLGASWAADDTIVLSQMGRLFRVRASGGEPEPLAAPDSVKEEAAYMFPTVLPGGRAVLYGVRLRNRQSNIVARADMGRGAPVTIVENGFAPQFLQPGYLLYAQEGRVLAVRFDAATLAVREPSAVVQDGVATKFSDGVSNVAVAANGNAAYVSGSSAPLPGRLVWFDRRGTRLASVVEQTLPDPRNLRLSPDGRRLVATVGPSGLGDIWVFDVSGATQPLKLTFRDHNTWPIWSPDGKRIAFVKIETGFGGRIHALPADGSAVEAERLSTGDGNDGLPMSWSPDARTILYSRDDGLWTLRLSDRAAAPWLQVPFAQYGGQLSPNGKWMAYSAAQTGRVEVWVRAFPGPGAPVRVSADGGADPIWSHDGTELFYRNGPQLETARVVTDGAEFRAQVPQAMFTGGFVFDDSDPGLRLYDVAPDGRFLMVERVQQNVAIVAAPNWGAQLTRQLPVK